MSDYPLTVYIDRLSSTPCKQLGTVKSIQCAGLHIGTPSCYHHRYHHCT